MTVAPCSVTALITCEKPASNAVVSSAVGTFRRTAAACCASMVLMLNSVIEILLGPHVGALVFSRRRNRLGVAARRGPAARPPRS